MFEKKIDGLLISYRLESMMTIEVAKSIALDLEQEFAKSPNISAVLFDFQDHDLHHKAFTVLTPLGQELRKKNKQIYALAKNKSVTSYIRKEGLDIVLKPISNIEEIGLGHSTKAAKKIDVRFINPFIEGTLHVLNVQCQTECVPSKPFLKGTGDFHCPTDIAGIIGITSKTFKGGIAICFPAPVFLGLMSKMLGEEYKEINDELKDGAGELLNMIFGHAKTILNESGHAIDQALPSVIRGPDLKVDHFGSNECIILPFNIGNTVFFMEIGVKEN